MFLLTNQDRQSSMTGKGYFCFTILSFKGWRSTHSRKFPFCLRTGTIREQYGEQLSLMISCFNRSSIISRICSRWVRANFQGAYAKIELSLSDTVTGTSFSCFSTGLSYVSFIMSYVRLSTSWSKSVLISESAMRKSSISITRVVRKVRAKSLLMALLARIKVRFS